MYRGVSPPDELALGALPSGKGGTAGIFSCVIALAFSGFGAGILSLPWALSTWGLFGGLLTQLVTAALAVLSSWVLLAAKRECPSAEGYVEVVTYFWPHRRVVTAVLVLDCFGSLVVFCIFGADAFLYCAKAFHIAVSSPSLVKLGICAVAAPLSFPRSITRVAALSPLCLTALLYICLLVIAQAVKPPTRLPRRDLSSLKLVTVSGASLKGLCAILFAFVLQVNIFSVIRELRNPTPRRKRLVTGLAIGLMLVCYTLVSACGYIAFGEEVRTNVLTNFDPERLSVKLGNMAMVAMLIVCFVLLVYPVREAVLGVLLQGKQEASNCMWVLTTAFVVSAAAIVAIALPSVVNALEALGGVCAPCLIFIFPALTLRFRQAPGRAGVLYLAGLLGFSTLLRDFAERAWRSF